MAGNGGKVPTTDELWSQGADDEVLYILEEQIEKRALLKYQEESLEKKKKKCNENIQRILAEMGIEKAKLAGIGSVSIVNKQYTNINREKLSISLVEFGLSTDEVTELIAQATKTSQSSYVEFRRDKS